MPVDKGMLIPEYRYKDEKELKIAMASFVLKKVK